MMRRGETIILVYCQRGEGRSHELNISVAQRSDRIRVVIKQENDNDYHITHSYSFPAGVDSVEI